ncbi:MAG: phage shock protein operon transcriptional activator [Deltaproteobacteria bacterium]|nr:MAG: phage shock protein operon transcriptional activator [Deltaproteobacteria bacterium]
MVTPEDTSAPIPEALGRSEAFLRFQEELSRVAPVERPVLILGERGTGKELAALRLHYLSRRWREPLVTLNCAAMAPGLITAELFGHEAGAFTGAARRRAGRFEAADGGTLFLDEIGNIPLEAQEQILRVVEYGVFERVGGTRPVKVDTRLVGATHADLAAMAARGLFMRDLLDRLSFEVLHLPPLREREGDIELLALHFAARMAAELGRREVVGFSPAALRRLRAHDWPGNVRELKNVVERAVYRCPGDEIDEQYVVMDPFRRREDAPPAARPPAPRAEATAGDERAEPAAAGVPQLPASLPEQLRRLELSMLRQALRQVHYNQRRAAPLLGLSYHQLRRLYRKYHSDL